MQKLLDELYLKYHAEQYLSSDPLEFVHRFKDPWDQEAVALLSAVLAYGNVKQIRKSVAFLIDFMRKEARSPSQYVKLLKSPDFRIRQKGLLKKFTHRFNRGKDIVLLLWLLSESWTKYGSLGAHFVSYLDPKQRNIESALNQLIRTWRFWAGKEGRGSFSYLLTSPNDGSCCKRWCMLLRWMGRKDSIDPGLWTTNGALAQTFIEKRGIRPDQLIIPLDTHTGRISQILGLTPRKTLNWKAAIEVTEALKSFDPVDPVRYDFAICRIGILDLYDQELGASPKRDQSP